MRRETNQAVYQDRRAGLTLEERIAQARTRAPREANVLEPTLPTSPLVPVVTLTTDQLHDLIYAATSQYLQTLAGMTRDRARRHAERVAAQADLIVHAEHTVRPGVPE